MRLSDTFKLYRSLSLHFKGKFDYHRYGASVKVTESNYKSLNYPEQKFISGLLDKKDPESFLLGNFIFNDINFVLDFSDEYGLHMEKYRSNGLMYFKRDLELLKPDVRDNLLIRSAGDIPHIVEQFENDKISMHTLCIFNYFFNTCNRWQNSESQILIDSLIKKISYSTGFFTENADKYKEVITKHYGL